MKNQYFGDINDYRKYGLLRILAAGGNNCIAVCWMRTEDNARSDGKFTGYLRNPDAWRSYDPGLFDFLYKTVGVKKERDINSVSRARLIPSASYFTSLLTDGNREEYFARFDQQLRQRQILFFDPDNGMEVRSVPKGKKGSQKYLYWREAEHFYSRGHSLLIYQHYPRMERERFIILRAADIFAMLRVPVVYSFKTPKVVFFLIPQMHHEEALRSRVREVGRAWGREIVPNQHHASLYAGEWKIHSITLSTRNT